MRRLLRQHPVPVDLALAALLCVLDLLVSWDTSRAGSGLGRVGTILFAAVGALPLGWRRRWPVWVFAAVLAHSLLAWVVAPGYLPTFGLWLALYTVAARRDRRTALAALLASFAPTALNVVDNVRQAAPTDRTDALVTAAVLGVLFDVAVYGVGRWVAWSARQRRIEAERAAADAVAAERVRVARDLHDIVAHSVSLMLLQAGGARRVLRRDPGRADTALGLVDELGQQAIVELRRLLGLLEQAPAPGGLEAVETPPATPSGLADLPALAERVQAGGVPVELAVTGMPAALEAGVDLSGYRIVQEALTNAARYAERSTPVQVAVRWDPDDVRIRVANRPAATRQGQALSIGRGLLGMAERARAVGGTLDAGPAPDGTFLVEASLPVARPAGPPRPLETAPGGPARPGDGR